MEVSLVETQARKGKQGGLQVNKRENDRHGAVLCLLAANAKNYVKNETQRSNTSKRFLSNKR